MSRLARGRPSAGQLRDVPPGDGLTYIYRVSGNYLFLVYMTGHCALMEQAEFYLDRASGYPQLSVSHMTHPGHMTLTPVKHL